MGDWFDVSKRLQRCRLHDGIGFNCRRYNNQTAYTVPALGQTGYEKIMPINPGLSNYVVMVLAGYNHGQEPAPNKIYVGLKGKAANGTDISFER